LREVIQIGFVGLDLQVLGGIPPKPTTPNPQTPI